jgi:hypothetical protein
VSFVVHLLRRVCIAAPAFASKGVTDSFFSKNAIVTTNTTTAREDFLDRIDRILQDGPGPFGILPIHVNPVNPVKKCLVVALTLTKLPQIKLHPSRHRRSERPAGATRGRAPAI